MKEQSALAKMALVDLFQQWPQAAALFQRYKVACVGCAVAPFCTVADAIAAYHLSPESFWAELEQVVGESPDNQAAN